MTSARRAAIRKAQLASARKRKGKRNKKIAAGAAVAGIGVLGVTMYASKGRKKRAGGAVNVVSETMTASPRAVSKELDLIRISPHDAGQNGLDYGEVGKPMRELNKTYLHKRQRQIDNKLNAHKQGRGKTVVTSNGVIKRVKRNRPGFNDSRRADYQPSKRRSNYLINQEAIKKSNRERARAKRTKHLLQQPVLGGITIDSSRFPKSHLTY